MGFWRGQNGLLRSSRPRGRRGFTLVEMLMAVVMLTFVGAGTATLLLVGQRQQRLARNYSQVQSDLRKGLLRITRTLRHGYQVVGQNTTYSASVSAFTATAARQSNASQLVVRIPEPAGTTPTSVELRFYRSGGILYAQHPADLAAGNPGIALLSGVQSLAFNYFRTGGTTTTVVDATPEQASEVRILVTAAREQAITTVETRISLRNALPGL